MATLRTSLLFQSPYCICYLVKLRKKLVVNLKNTVRRTVLKFIFNWMKMKSKCSVAGCGIRTHHSRKRMLRHIGNYCTSWFLGTRYSPSGFWTFQCSCCRQFNDVGLIDNVCIFLSQNDSQYLYCGLRTLFGSGSWFSYSFGSGSGYKA